MTDSSLRASQFQPKAAAISCRCRFDTATSIHTLDCPGHNRQANAGAFVFTRHMEPLKNTEHFLATLRFNPDSVILYINPNPASCAF
jgi:hypothetical protein